MCDFLYATKCPHYKSCWNEDDVKDIERIRKDNFNEVKKGA